MEILDIVRFTCLMELEREFKLTIFEFNRVHYSIIKSYIIELELKLTILLS